MDDMVSTNVIMMKLPAAWQSAEHPIGLSKNALCEPYVPLTLRFSLPSAPDQGSCPFTPGHHCSVRHDGATGPGRCIQVRRALEQMKR